MRASLREERIVWQDGWLHHTAGDQPAWDGVPLIGPDERTCGPEARREGGVPGSNFSHPYVVLLLHHYFFFFFFLPFRCVKVTMVQNRSCKTHLNKSAEVPGDSKTPSDRQASFKCSLKSAPNARCPPPLPFHPKRNYFTAGPMRGCPGAGEFRNSSRNWKGAELILWQARKKNLLLWIKVCISGRHGSSALLGFPPSLVQLHPFQMQGQLGETIVPL